MKLLFVFCLVFSSEIVKLCQGFDGRIFDGIDANIIDYPWMVSVRLSTVNHLCGGAIVSDSFVLTAASCFPSILISLPSVFVIKAGINQLVDGNERTEQIRNVSQVILHPQFNAAKPNENNLALIQLRNPWDLVDSNISSIALSYLSSFDNVDLITLGWGFGYQSNQSALPKYLQQKIIRENVECASKDLTDPSTQLCAEGTCVGDIGGPLMIYLNETLTYELVGLTSFRNACLTEGIYTRLYPFLDWINSTMINPPLTKPPIIITPPSPATLPTPKPDVLGPPIYFRCNISSTCGCSPTPVIFRDEPPFPPTHRSIQSRIVGGENAEANSWSWIVSFRSFNIHFCGGTILTDQWILTAAHCFQTTIMIGISVHIGAHNETQPSPQVRTIAEVIKHPDFDFPTYVNDIALVRLTTPIDFISGTNYVTLTCLPPRNIGLNYPKVGQQLAVIGWGRLLYGGIRPTVLRQVRVNTIANDDRRCLNSIKNVNRQFCAMVDGGGKDSCQGDSGGPIHRWLGDRWEQVGIVSFGNGCANENYPGVYTRLSMFHDWIDMTMNGIVSTEATSLSTTSTISSTSSISTPQCKTTTTSKSIMNLTSSMLVISSSSHGSTTTTSTSMINSTPYQSEPTTTKTTTSTSMINSTSYQSESTTTLRSSGIRSKFIVKGFILPSLMLFVFFMII